LEKILLGSIVEELKRTCKEDVSKVTSEYYDKEISIIDIDKARRAASIFKILSNPIRLRILSVLEKAELPVCVLTALLGIDQTLLSHHLTILKNYGLIGVKVKGRFRIYYLANKELFRKISETIELLGK
jgi:DNA-binding transcriptional ArsR family regulator